MFYCYILFSLKLNKYYIGSTADVEGRLRRHNANHQGFTGSAADWVLTYQEAFGTKPEAVKAGKADKKLEKQEND